MSFRLISDSDYQWAAEGSLPIPASGDGQSVRAGDEIYVLTDGESGRLLARLSVLEVSLDEFRHRVNLKIGGPRSAVFFHHWDDAVTVHLSSEINRQSRNEIERLDSESADQLRQICGFS